METKMTTDVHKRTYRLTWGQQELDVRPYPYSRTGRQYQPVGAMVNVSREFDGPWELYALALHGRALKKDGTVGLQDVEEKFWSFDREKAPQQLLDAVKEILASLNDPDTVLVITEEQAEQIANAMIEHTSFEGVREELVAFGIEVSE